MNVERVLGTMALMCLLLTPTAAHATTKKAAPKPRSAAVSGMFSAGSTTLPPGEYRLINDKKGLEYHITVSGGKMMVKDIKPLGIAQSASPEHPQPATQPAAAPVTTSTIPSAIPAVAGTDGSVPTTAATLPAQDGSKNSKLQSLIKGQAQRQIKRHGSKIERELRKIIKL